VIAAEPTFEAVLHYARVTRAESVVLPLDAAFRHDLRAMARACDARTGLVYVCNPNNPTGTVVSLASLTGFMEQVPKTAVVVVDEAYHHFVEDKGYGSAGGLLGRFPNLVVARTFSKIYGMAGMRLGYAVTSATNAEAMRAHASWSTVNVAVLEAGLACLKDSELPRQQRALLNGSRRALCHALEKQGRRYIPSEANFLMIDVGADVAPLVSAFAMKGIRVGRRFAAMPNWLRVTIGRPEETEAFFRALGELVPAKAAA
jgi:histidinol-phosphate aminotransferase